MATEAQLTARIAALEAALGSGALSVAHAGKTVTYRSAAELREEIRSMRRQLASPKKKLIGYVAHSRGLGGSCGASTD